MTDPSVALGIVPAPKTADAEPLGISGKQKEVLDVASECFLTHGYEGASINAMARSSGISKESIYRYFSSKKELFEAVIDRELVEYQRKLVQLDTILKTMQLRQALVAIAETVLGVITTDKTLALRRLIFDEAARSPAIGHHYYRIGPERAYTSLNRLFDEHLDDSRFESRRLAQHFIGMLSYSVMLERQCHVREALSPAEITSVANAVVDDFVAAFLKGSDEAPAPAR